MTLFPNPTTAAWLADLALSRAYHSARAGWSITDAVQEARCFAVTFRGGAGGRLAGG